MSNETKPNEARPVAVKEDELLQQMHSDIEKVHKEMWSAVKDHNADAFCALAQEFSRSATLLATDWTVSAALAKIAVELTDK